MNKTGAVVIFAKGRGRLDLEVAEYMRAAILYAAGEFERPTIRRVAGRLGLLPDRLSRLLDALEIREGFDENQRIATATGRAPNMLKVR